MEAAAPVTDNADITTEDIYGLIDETITFDDIEKRRRELEKLKESFRWDLPGKSEEERAALILRSAAISEKEFWKHHGAAQNARWAARWKLPADHYWHPENEARRAHANKHIAS